MSDKPWSFVPSHIAEGPSEVRHADGWLICCPPSDELAQMISATPDLLAFAQWVADHGGDNNQMEIFKRARVVIAKAGALPTPPAPGRE